MDRSYIKPILGDAWDSYQVKVIQMGGNKKIWEFLKQYNGLEQKPIHSKYLSSAAQYYKKKLAAEATNQVFTDKEPPKNAEEILDRGVEGAKNLASKTGEGIVKGYNILGDKIAESGIKDKVKGLFGKK